MEKGRLSVHTENILPVIKKWLYSEKEIFLRELVSNAFDAITKLKKTALTETVFQAEDADYSVDISVDKAAGTLVFEDNGIGMTAEEITKYIAQIAFSGAEEFVKKFEDLDRTKSGIIGNFGLGFYSCFMVAKRVEIESRSWQIDAKPARWTSDGTEEFEIGEGSRQKRGTTITLILDDENKDLLESTRIIDLARKYCDFMPVPVRVGGSQVNKQEALWTKQPSSLKREDYFSFYRELFPMQGDPLFYIHLNVDYPFRLQGILFFPRLAHELDLNRSNVKIYCKQVFVTDEAQELIPKFLTVLQGVLDMPDLPLNVSRSYIQNEPEVKKIAGHIVKKVADRLLDENKSHPEEYRKIWPEIAPFVKFGMMNDEKFYEQCESALLFEKATLAPETAKQFCTLDQYIDSNKDKTQGRVYYTSDVKSQAGALRMLEKQGVEALLLGTMIDTHFVHFLESKKPDFRFVRVDAEVLDSALDKDASSKLVDADNKSLDENVRALFEKAVGNPKVIIRVEALKSEEIPAMILLPEHMRRITEMTAMMAQKMADFPVDHTLLINTKSPLIQAMARPSIVAGDGPSKAERAARQIYELALLERGGLDTSKLHEFIAKSYDVLKAFLG